MPDNEQLGIICLLGLLIVLYVIGLAIKYAVEFWYVVIGVVLAVAYLNAWLRRRNPIYLDEIDDWESVPQE